MTRVVKLREYRTSVGHIPDEFSISGIEDKILLEYTEVYLHLQQHEAIEQVRKKMKDRFFRIGEEVRIECRAN